MHAVARRILDETPWDLLNHAYGPATDAPEALRGLLSPDEEVRDGSLDYLYGSILHQGTAYTATPPACLYLCALLTDADAGVDPELRPKLVGVLSDVAVIAAHARSRRPLLETLTSFDIAQFEDRSGQGSEGRDEALRPYLVAYRTLHPGPVEQFRLDGAMLLHFINAAARGAVGALACLPIAADLRACLEALLDDPNPQTRAAAAMGADPAAPPPRGPRSPA